MYYRPFIQEHDKTTSNGDVQARYNGIHVIDQDGTRNICFEGDSVFCPACKTTGVTKCVPPYRSWTGHDGRQVNLDGDLCLCKCFPPPRLIASDRNRRMIFDTDEITSIPGAEDWSEYAGYKLFSYTQCFLILNEETGQPDAGRKYQITYSKGVFEGQTDANGLTNSVGSNSPESVKIELF